MLGILFALLAAAGWGVDSVVARQGLRQIPPSIGTFISLWATLPVIVLLALLIDPDGFRRLLSPAALAWFILLGILNFPIARQLNFRATRYLGAARASAIFAGAPLVSVVLAILVLGEGPTLPTLLGASLIVLGVGLVVSSR